MPAKTEPQSVSRNSSSSTQSTQPKPQPNLARHARKCAICNHPRREHIEDDFVSWRSENTIALEYQISSRSSIFRHAAATGLLARRRRNLRGVAERILGNVDQAPPSASAVLRALRIFTQITEDGQWVEPAKRSIVTHIHITKHESAAAAANHGAPSAETVGAGLSRPPTSPNHDNPPNCYSERVPMSSIGTTTNLHFDQSASPIERDVQSHAPDVPSAPAIAVEASSRVSTTTAPDDDYYDRLEYIPHWARGIVPERPRATALKKEPVSAATRPNINEQNTLPHASAPEILTGHQNASPETSTNRKYAP